MCEVSDLTVLVCDDKKDDLDSTCDILEKAGVVKLLCAENRKQFEECIDRYLIDIAILDVTLAWGSGLDLGCVLKKRQPECILLFSSETGTRASYTMALLAGANGFICKTITRAGQEITGVVNHWIQMRTHFRSLKEHISTLECCGGR